MHEIPQEPYVELIRVSTSAQAQKDTHQKQRHELDRYAERHPGGKRVARIEAPGVSGTLSLNATPEGRELQKLAGKFAVLRITKLNRVFGGRSEDPEYKAQVAAVCYRNGAKILEVSSGQVYDPRDPMSQMMLMIGLGFSAKERSDLVENCNKGRMRAAREGRSPGGARRYYGRRYNTETRHWEYDEVERGVFAEIHRWVVEEGVSYHAIARRLNARGIPSLRGRVWYARTIANLLQHRHLVGESSYTNRHVPGEQIELRIPPLLTETEWRRLQDVLALRRSPSKATKSTAALCIGRIFCPCGQRMNRKEKSYVCSTSHANWQDAGRPQCEYKKYHQIAAVDAAVWQEIKTYLSGDLIAEATTRDPDIAQHQEAVEECERLLTDLQRREKTLATMYLGASMTDTTWRDLQKEIQTRRRTLEATLHVNQAALASAELASATAETLKAAIQEMRDRIDDATLEDRRALLQALIPNTAGYGITVHPDGKIAVRAGMLVPQTATGGETCKSACLSTNFTPGQIIEFRLRTVVGAGKKRTAG